MNTYEFWDDMGKIFDAIVAYQEKTIEFNKRFINPWVKLGNVFDKEESSKAIAAHKNAIEINPENAQVWYDLASAHGRAGEFEKSIRAYQKAIDLGFESGELHKNMAMAYVMAGKHQEAIPHLEKGLDLFENAEDKAAVWNHLGNAYRKLNNYEMALQAFQQADQFATEVSNDVNTVSADGANASQPTDEPAAVMEDESTTDDVDVEETEVSQEQQEEEPVEPSSEAAVADLESEEVEEELGAKDGEALPVILELDFSTESPEAEAEEAVDNDVNIEEEVGSEFLAALENGFDEPVQVEDPVEETEPEDETEAEDTPKAIPAASSETEQTPDPSETIPSMTEDNEGEVEKVEEYVDIEDMVAEPVLSSETDVPEEERLEESIDVEESEMDIEPALENEETSTLSAYDEYLNDNQETDIVNLVNSESEETQTIAMAPTAVELTNPEINMDINSDLVLDADTKNAHVWNELGNVYLNAGSFDDAIAAYSKAIELDEKFAWPYTNLAMSYVQKGRLDESVLLYQRSIELFENEKDKAVTWNRLGNVYRRLNDYEKAIAAYQRADELDPDNIAITQQARFSLLGSEQVNQELEYSV